MTTSPTKALDFSDGALTSRGIVSAEFWNEMRDLTSTRDLVAVAAILL